MKGAALVESDAGSLFPPPFLRVVERGNEGSGVCFLCSYGLFYYMRVLKRGEDSIKHLKFLFFLVERSVYICSLLIYEL